MRILANLKENKMRPYLAKLIDRQHRDYPQLWYFVCRVRPHWLKKLFQCLCGLMSHGLSKTEWAYGGGDYAVRWCRWCNKRFVVPKTSIYFQFRGAREFVNRLDQEIKSDGY